MSTELYSTAELAAMSTEDLRLAQANGFVKSATEAAKTQGLEANFSTATPAQPSPPQDPYAPTAWGSRFYDFTTPSGQTCQLRKLDPGELIKTGLLDKITRLPALADEEIRKAEGAPPVKRVAMPSTQDMQALVEVVDQLLPMVVVQPKVWPDEDGQPRIEGRVYVSDVELGDRIAIMNRATTGVAALDNFREES